MTTHSELAQPWWREPWPWILMAGPLIAMLACLVTMVLAAQGFDAQVIRDGGRKQGLVVSKPAAPGGASGAPAQPQVSDPHRGAP